MLNITSKNDGCGIDIKTKPLRFLVNLFKKKRIPEIPTPNVMESGSRSGSFFDIL